MAGPGRRGPAPLPTEAKRLRGNPGKRALPATVIVLPPASEQALTVLPTTGDELVAGLLASAAASWIATPDRLAAMQLLGEGWDRRRELQEDIAEHGSSYSSTTQAGLRYFRRPESLELDELEKRLTGWLSLLGLTPSDRSRLGVAEVKAQSKLEALRDRRGNRLARSRAG